MRFVYQAVERIPSQLQNGIVYHSEEFELAGLLCACGCAHRITLLVADGHEVISENGLATVRPSIAVCDAACKSHYVITAGNVEWLEAYSTAGARILMQGQIARHAAKDAKPKTWINRLIDAAGRFVTRIKSIFWS
jgi:hypothetical protein